ncbi:MAG: ATP-binding protein [Erysipelotrichaceae bacterium]|nr:ATP-binding protein [Erysipelotrichaceae bacterium]
MFIGRKLELQTLKDKLENDSLEVGVIYGQRRIGKTSLIREAINDKDYVYFLARDAGIQENLNELNKVLNKYYNLPSINEFKSISDALDKFNELSKNKTILVIDELPFLAKAYPGIISYLQGYIDDNKREGKAVKLILSGSDMSFMSDLLKDKAKPLYQRVTFKIHVKPMLFLDAIKILDGIDNVDKAKYLAIFGNRPYYLEKIDKKKNFNTNIKNMCFDNTSILIDAPNTTLPIGYSSNSTFISIMIAISNRKHKIKEIADALNIDDKAVSTYLKRMQDGEVVEKRDIFNGNKKTIYYEISDPFIRFYYSVIYNNLPDIERGYKEEVFTSNIDRINNIIEHGFEDVVNSYIHELNIDRKLNKTYHDIQKYTVDNSLLKRSVQIDGLSESFDKNSLLVVEAKFRDKDISLKIYEHLKESASIFPNYMEKEYYLISKKSFSDDIKNIKDKNLHLISLNEMMSYKK